MRSLLILISCVFLSLVLQAQSQAGIEQYHYIGDPNSSSVVPVIHYKTSKGWYGEARYNYDEANTFSILGGKTFSLNSRWLIDVTPMAGIAAGRMSGWTGGVNLFIEKNQFFFSTQSQYTRSTTTGYQNFLFNWCELAYQPFSWLYGGVSIQHTHVLDEKPLFEPGFMVGPSVGQLSFPLYVFNTFSSKRFFVLGVNYEWGR